MDEQIPGDRQRPPSHDEPPRQLSGFEAARPPPDLRVSLGRFGEQEVLVISFAVDRSGGDVWPELTGAQRQVVALCLAGYTSGEIAAKRGTRPTTVAHQLAEIYRRLGIGSRGELFALNLSRRRLTRT
jgi:DNA-binding CsgD family transcriptional regulator